MSCSQRLVFKTKGNALCRHTAGDNDGALADVNRALELKPNYDFALAQRGACRSEFESSCVLCATIEWAVIRGNLHSHCSQCYALLIHATGTKCHAICRHTAGDNDGALADVNQALELKPNDSFALAQRGSCS